MALRKRLRNDKRSKNTWDAWDEWARILLLFLQAVQVLYWLGRLRHCHGEVYNSGGPHK